MPSGITEDDLERITEFARRSRYDRRPAMLRPDETSENGDDLRQKEERSE